MKKKTSNMKSNLIITLTLFLIIITSCSTPKKSIQNKFDGIYINEKNKNIQLLVKDGNFLHINKEPRKDLALFKCCDTLSYGKVEYLNKASLLAFTSSKDSNGEYLTFTIEEYEDVNQDSIQFIFTNPIENHYKKFKESYRELLYAVEVLNGDFQNIISDKNPVSIASKNGIKEFQIKIFPKYDIPLNHLEIREVKLKPYKVINNKANVFKITISQLDYGYLAFKRLNEDYVKIVTNSKLIWDGDVYLKI